MMATSIGKMNLMLGADASGFNSALGNAERRVQTFGSRVKKELKDIGGGLALTPGLLLGGGKFALSGLGGLTSLLSNPLKPFENAFKGFTAPVLAPDSMFQQIARTVKEADRLGISTQV